MAIWRLAICDRCEREQRFGEEGPDNPYEPVPAGWQELSARSDQTDEDGDYRWARRLFCSVGCLAAALRAEAPA